MKEKQVIVVKNQEGWREGILKNEDFWKYYLVDEIGFVTIMEYLGYDKDLGYEYMCFWEEEGECGEEYIDEKDMNKCIVEYLDDFISQLLSERTFSKEELFMLKLATNEIHNKGNNAYDEIGDKISKLLKE